MLDAIKKKNDSNLIDLTLFSEVTALNNNCDSLDDIEWSDVVEQQSESRSRRNLTKTFTKESTGVRVRDSVLEAFDPLLESDLKSTFTETEISSKKFSSI